MTHILPAIQLGFGRGDVGHKFVTLMHMLKLLSPKLSILPQIVQSVITLTSDYGVESAVPRVQPMSVGDVFPYIKEDDYSDDEESELDIDRRIEDDFALPAFVKAPQEEDRVPDQRCPRQLQDMLDLSGSTEVGGLLHIIHNAGKSLANQLKFYTDATFRLQKVTTFCVRRRRSNA